MAFNSASQRETQIGKPSSYPSENTSRSYLGKSMQIKGKISSDELLTIDGKVIGNIQLTKTLTIGKNGFVEGDITAESVRIEGEVEGVINASNKLELSSQGKFSGTVKSEKLVIEEGAMFKGKINIDD